MSTMRVDNITEKTSGAGVQIPGHSIQHLHQTITSYNSTSSTSVVATGFTLTITPKSTSSLIKATVGFAGMFAAVGNTSINLDIYKGGSFLAHLDNIVGYGISGQNSTQAANPVHVYIDSPNTTSATTYAIFWSRVSGSGSVYFNNYHSGENQTRSWYTLEEIAQ